MCCCCGLSSSRKVGNLSVVQFWAWGTNAASGCCCDHHHHHRRGLGTTSVESVFLGRSVLKIAHGFGVFVDSLFLGLPWSQNCCCCCCFWGATYVLNVRKFVRFWIRDWHFSSLFFSTAGRQAGRQDGVFRPNLELSSGSGTAHLLNPRWILHAIQAWIICLWWQNFLKHFFSSANPFLGSSMHPLLLWGMCDRIFVACRKKFTSYSIRA